MTRVLFWNIQQFGIEKIGSASHKRLRVGLGGNTKQEAAAQRLGLLMQVFRAANPDVIVVVELASGNSVPFGLATFTDGMNGAIFLLNQLNATPALNPLAPAAVWALVPPLRCGPTESVAVYFRRQTGATLRYFTGPNIWTGGPNGFSTDPTVLGAPGAAVYPGPALGVPDINGMLVPAGTAARIIPVGAQYNGALGRSENQVAARVMLRVNTPVMGAPAPGIPLDFNVWRAPYMVTFYETGGGPARNLTLFGVHAPPANAQGYLALMATAYELAQPLGANETRLIGGDFNLNLLDGAGAPSGAYGPITGLAPGYRLLLEPTIPGGPAGPVDQYRGYFSTHIRPEDRTAASRFLWSDGANASYYPGYGYVGSDGVAAPFYSIDNILVAPRLGPPHDYETTVMNLVTGTPFNAIAARPGNPPIGTVAMAHAFTTPPLWWPALYPPPVGNPVAPNYQGLPEARKLTGWRNYGRILKTSDHFAVFANV